MDVLTARLHAAVAAVCPITGVSVGTPGVPASVTVHHAPEATPAQQTAAAGVVAGFDWSAAAQTAWERGQEPDLRDLLDQAAAAIAAIDAYLPTADTATNAQVRAEVKAIDQRQRRLIQAVRRLAQRTWRN